MDFRFAKTSDMEAVVALINAAFRPAESFFIDEDRITLAQARTALEIGDFLVADEGGVLAAALYLELRRERAYFGMLSVHPDRQRTGLGRRIIQKAEEFAREQGCRFMDLTVVNLRTELPSYYAQLGYVPDGTEPFPPEVPTKLPCHLLRMSKSLEPGAQAADV